MYTVLFICTGNTCRSAMAEGIFKELISEDDIFKDVEVMSVGTGVYSLESANYHAISTLKEMSIDIEKHRSKMVTEEVIINADLILTMTMSHKQMVINMIPQAKSKTFTLKEFDDKKQGNIDISDPYGLSLDEYKKCAEEIYNALIKAKNKIKKIINI